MNALDVQHWLKVLADTSPEKPLGKPVYNFCGQEHPPPPMPVYNIVGGKEPPLGKPVYNFGEPKNPPPSRPIPDAVDGKEPPLGKPVYNFAPTQS